METTGEKDSRNKNRVPGAVFILSTNRFSTARQSRVPWLTQCRLRSPRCGTVFTKTGSPDLSRYHSATAAEARAEPGVWEQASPEVAGKSLASRAVPADFLHREDLAATEAAPAVDRPTIVPEACSALANRDSVRATSDLAPAASDLAVSLPGDSLLAGNPDDCPDRMVAFRIQGDSPAAVACSWVDGSPSCRRIPDG